MKVEVDVKKNVKTSELRSCAKDLVSPSLTVLMV